MTSTARPVAMRAPAAPAGAILAIDYGRKRWGLAISDSLALTARPLAVWNRTNRRRDLARLRALAREHQVRRIVVGLPLHLDGTPSEMSEEARGFAARVEKALGIPTAMADERLSSWAAGELAAELPRSREKNRSRDDLAAALILRGYLEREHASGEKTD